MDPRPKLLILVLTAIVASSTALACLHHYGGQHIARYRRSFAVLEVYRLVYEVAREVEEIRGLRFTKRVEVVLIDTSWALKAWAPNEGVEIPRELLYREVLYKLTLLIPYDKSIVQMERAWVGMFVAAVAGTTLYINTDYFKPEDPSARNILAHELAHVLQFLHMDMKWPSTLDAGKAFAALIEGDAGWVQHLYCNRTRLCEPSPPTPLHLHDAYLSLNLFPYVYGERFVRYLYERGGWDLVNKAYEKPPKSTLMVMKPELYLEYLLNSSDPLIDVPISAAVEAEPVYTDTLGPYYIMLVLARFVGLEKAVDIAMGWRGDRVAVYSMSSADGEAWLVLWNTTWSSPHHAAYFYANLTQALDRLGDVFYLGDSVAASIAVDGRGVHAVTLRISNASVFIESRYVGRRL